MGSLIINHNLVTDENAKELQALCPFGAISYDDGKLDISSGCKMCKLCVKKSNGIITYIEDVKVKVDKELWKGICVYVDHLAGRIHRVTYELIGKAIALSKVVQT